MNPYTHKRLEKVRMSEKIKLKKILMICLCIVFLPVTQVQAKKSKNYWPKLSDDITAGSAILMDIDTGTILYKKNINEKYYPASITKILTTLIAIENSSMDEVVTFSSDAIYKTIYEVERSSSIWRDIGEEMTMEECLYAVMLESANECAYAVAEHVGGTLTKFVKMMNEKAKELGATSSHFANPHGLPDEKHYLTANDMAIIARAAYQNETFRLICGTKRYTIPPTNKHSEPTYLTNHHKMLYPKDTAAYLYDYCMGGKTGYTSVAGNTLVTYAEKDGMNLVAVILNGTSPQYWNETRSLFEFGFENFNLCNVAEYSDTDENSKDVKYDTLNTNDPYAQIDPQAKIILPKSVNFSKTTMEIVYDQLPDNVLAQLKYTYGKHEIGTADLIRTNTLIDQNGIIAENEETENSNDDQSATTANDVSDDTSSADDSVAAGNTKNNDTDSTNTDQPAESEEHKEDSKKFSFSNFSFKNIDFKKYLSNIKDFFGNISFEFSLNTLIVIAGIALGIILIVVFIVIYNKSYVIRQKIANYKNRKRANKQYVIIRETRKSRGRRRRNR